MSRLEKLELEVQQLPPEELAAFREWFAEFDEDQWDRQIQADAKAGRLEELAERARREDAAGRTREL